MFLPVSDFLGIDNQTGFKLCLCFLAVDSNGEYKENYWFCESVDLGFEY